MATLINRNWVFGSHAGLDFSTPTPTASSSNDINTKEGCASISDDNGNLIMYTDGTKVWDSGNTEQPITLSGNSSSTQSSIIVPDPGNVDRYYIFTAAGSTAGDHHVDGVRIDTSTPSWSFTQLADLMTMPPTAGHSPTEKLTAIQHSNCTDFWVITILQKDQPLDTANALNCTLRIFLVNSTGVQYVGDTPLPPNLYVHDTGYLKGSPNGKWIAATNTPLNDVVVYPFDNATGGIDLPNAITISPPQKDGVSTYGVEFSPNSNILYYSVLTGTTSDDPGLIFQHDLLNPSIPSIQVGVHKNDTQGDEAKRYALGALQLGMDNRIYIAQDGEAKLGVINNPDVLGAAGCDLQFGAVQLTAGSTCYMGLPNLIPNPCPCPCEKGNCDDAVEEANQTLNQQATGKFITIIANGQSISPRCGPLCVEVNFAPAFSLHWGDSSTDQFESHDTEIVYIRIHNTFSNLIFRGVKIFNINIVPNQVLPSGENALQLIPAEIVCFDEIEPCSYVSRGFAFLIQNAVVGEYQITFDYCVEEVAIVALGNGSASFDIDVVAS